MRYGFCQTLDCGSEADDRDLMRVDGAALKVGCCSCGQDELNKLSWQKLRKKEQRKREGVGNTKFKYASLVTRWVGVFWVVTTRLLAPDLLWPSVLTQMNRPFLFEAVSWSTVLNSMGWIGLISLSASATARGGSELAPRRKLHRSIATDPIWTQPSLPNQSMDL